jgi:hypothetical protein
MRTDNTVALHSHALGTLKYIRASIDAAGTIAVPGSAGIAMGTAGVLATCLASLPALAPYWMAIWIVAAVGAAAVGSMRMVRQAARGELTLTRGPTRKFILTLCPALLAGAVLTFVLTQVGEARLIPGIWLLLYGCAVLSAAMMSAPSIARFIGTMGAIFVLLGILAFELPEAWHAGNRLLGMGFGLLHLIFGSLIGRQSRE